MVEITCASIEGAAISSELFHRSMLPCISTRLEDVTCEEMDHILEALRNLVKGQILCGAFKS